VQVCEEQSFKGLETGVDWIQLWKWRKPDGEVKHMLMECLHNYR
jgi:hypothetical protein